MQSTYLLQRADLSREARRWLAKLQKSWFFRLWGDASTLSADIEFARDEGGHKTGTTSHRKPFEGLKKEGTCLPDDVIHRLDLDPRFTGIRALSQSLFWKLFDQPITSPATAVGLVDQILATLDFARFSVGGEELWIRNNRPTLEISFDLDPSEFDDSDALALKSLKAIVDCRPVRLDVVALLGALYRELHLTHELDAALIVRNWFWELLEEFLSFQLFDEVGDDFKDYAVNRILYGETVSTAEKSFGVFSKRRLPGHPIGLILPARNYRF